MNGYQPDGKHPLDTSNPPRGGSGVQRNTSWHTDLRGLSLEVAHWQETTFGKLPPVAYLAKLFEETNELLESPYSLEEAADCLILLLGVVAAQGHSAEELLAAAWAKHAENMRREWVQNPDGTWRHEG
jgi:hypothetical protein